MSEPLAIHDYSSEAPQAALEFLKRTRFELRELRKVRVWTDKIQLFDINNDSFLVQGIGYPEPEVRLLLDHINTAYNPETLHEPTDDEYKEFKTGRRRPWAEDRVM